MFCPGDQMWWDDSCLCILHISIDTTQPGLPLCPCPEFIVCSPAPGPVCGPAGGHITQGGRHKVKTTRVTILTITPANNFQNTSAGCWLLWFLPPTLFRSVCHAMLLLKLLEAFFRFKLTVKCSLMLALSGLGWIRNQDSQVMANVCWLGIIRHSLPTAIVSARLFHTHKAGIKSKYTEKWRNGTGRRTTIETIK